MSKKFPDFIPHVTKLKEGQPAPWFEAKDHNGKPVTLEKLKGKKVILYFYPKDDTPTCTKEACNFKTNYLKLKKLGFEIIGVSPDTEKKHQKFRIKYKLPFRLIADIERELIYAYNVWGEKLFMGRILTSVCRTTFVIDENGIIEKIILKVKSAEAAEQVLDELDMGNSF